MEEEKEEEKEEKEKEEEEEERISIETGETRHILEGEMEGRGARREEQ